MQSQKNSVTITTHQFEFLRLAVFQLTDVIDQLFLGEEYPNSLCVESLSLQKQLKKFSQYLGQSGDACRHPVQSPDAVGQGGTDA